MQIFQISLNALENIMLFYCCGLVDKILRKDIDFWERATRVRNGNTDKT